MGKKKKEKKSKSKEEKLLKKKKSEKTHSEKEKRKETPELQEPAVPAAGKNSQEKCVPGNQEMAGLFRIFADESRLQILDLLKEEELCAGDLLKSMSIVQSTLSHHMKVLAEAGIVKQRKQGKWTYYSINKEMLAVLCSCIMKWS